MQPQYTDEQLKDIEARVNDFQTKFQALTEELQVSLMAMPQFVPHPTGTFGIITVIQVMDKKYSPVPSPIIKE